MLCKPEVPNPVRNWAARQEVSGGRASEASPAFTAEPHHVHYCLSSASCQISGGIRLETKCTIHVMYLNHPQTSPHPRSVEEVSVMKSVPDAKIVEEQ